jgi:uncharacterized protein YggT (Ycf19 family)
VMSDLFILYLCFSYLFCIGVISKSWNKENIPQKIGRVIFLVFAPIFIPIRLGNCHKDK